MQATHVVYWKIFKIRNRPLIFLTLKTNTNFDLTHPFICYRVSKGTLGLYIVVTQLFPSNFVDNPTASYTFRTITEEFHINTPPLGPLFHFIQQFSDNTPNSVNH